ncbi:hypothetical protein [Flavobacterium sp. JP2137]|uniref:hypothetical protein n=1 Tax=Flavobacterium sp. JP2137 TaxID=3414510 RepID=UPI003D2FE293
MRKLATITIVILMLIALVLLSVPTLDRECVRDVVLIPAFIIALSLLWGKFKKR